VPHRNIKIITHNIAKVHVIDKICPIDERDILCTQPNTMKIKSQTVRIAFWILLGIAIAFTSLALNRPAPLAQEGTATPTPLTDTISAKAEAREEAGSTDGIMLMAIVIVMIVIIPILVRRKAWSNGRGKR
jgi:hypothetical protein